MSYATIADVATYGGIQDLQDDARITLALAAAEEAVNQFCNRDFNVPTSATTRVFKPHDRKRRQLIIDDLASTSGLVIVDTVAGYTFAASDYVLEPANAATAGDPYTSIRALNRLWPVGRNNEDVVSITGRWGWPVIPDSVKLATVVLALELFTARNAPFGVAGFGEFGPVRIRNNPYVSRLLGQYRRGDTSWGLA